MHRHDHDLRGAWWSAYFGDALDLFPLHVYIKCDRLPDFPANAGRDLYVSAIRPETVVPLVDRILVFFKKRRHGGERSAHGALPRENAVRESK
jgi:hypothetical protein